MLLLRLCRCGHGFEGEDVDWELREQLLIWEGPEDVVVHRFSAPRSDLVVVARYSLEVLAHLLLPLW